jgi:mRNA interferase MazF
LAAGLKRGDFVILAIPGDYGKPRPALIVQNDIYADLGSLVICPLTTELRTYSHFRLPVAPTPSNGVEKQSQIMVDKITAVGRERVQKRIGEADDTLMAAVSVALATFLAIE